MSDFPQEFPEHMPMNHLSTAAAPPRATSPSLENHTAGCGRPSHLSALSSHQPSSRRPNPNHASPPASAAAAGYAKLPLPISFPEAERSHLTRTYSEPIHYLGGHTRSEIQMPPPQETSNAVQRTVSDPSCFANLGTPPPLSRKSSGSPSCGESPSVKRLRRMKERMKEMNRWWTQVMSEGDEEDGEIENNCDHIPKDESETETENTPQEAVWVEKNGDGLVLHFRCPCGEGYQILLSGSDCYYKLTSF